jgi:nucleoside 2-deoxyribosyltransferase
MRPRVYLAGPEVFLPGAAAVLTKKRAVCERYGLVGVSGLDPRSDEPAAWARLHEWQRLYLRNEAHIRDCAALIANLTPFRGPSADPGTVYELGFMRALGRPVLGYSATATPFFERTVAALGLSASATSTLDGEGMLIEQFGLIDNLMIEGGIAAAGGVLLTADQPAAGRWTDLGLFERCVMELARVLAARAKR